ncbi:heterokaryon incompatibility protein-domain-containing protein [Hypoxylon sp. FL1284]|nr:heterokaryon incompatibility protein-domain-containing protein [Hypoxylon sp. FL1284]
MSAWYAEVYFRCLHKDEFRLMSLRSGSWKTPLQCKLIIEQFENAPQYQALSYAWGSRSVTRPILVNGVEMEITVNLDTALRHLRREDADILLWVDALSINQRDLHERQAQVQRMRNIYNLATSVIVFLGDGTFHMSPKPPSSTKPPEFSFLGNEQDFQHIERFVENSASKRVRGLPDGFGVFSLIAIFALQSQKHKDALSNIQEKVLRNLFEELRIMLLSKWWSRMWVFQEIVVSRNPLLRYGGSTSSWEMFTRAAQNIESTLDADNLDNLPWDCVKVLKLLARTVSDIEHNRRRWASSTTAYHNAGAELHALLQATNRRNASDDRDKVYSLLGLLSDKLDISPDYHLTTSEVYISVARNIIRSTESLDVLVGDLGRKNRGDLPSWVPDWSAIIDNEELRRSQVMTQLYNACKGAKTTCWTSPASFWESVCMNILRRIDFPWLDSRACNMINALSRLGLIHTNGPRLIEQLTQGPGDTDLWPRWRDIGNGHMYAPESRLLCTPAAFVGGIEFVSEQFHDSADVRLSYRLAKREPSEVNLSFRKLRAMVFDLKFVSGRFERLGKDDEVHLRRWYDARTFNTRQAYQDVLGFDYVLKFMSPRRRLFMTYSGDLGWGPDSIAPGDEVYILPGGRIPFVIRRQTKSIRCPERQMVGGCYLQGVMDGQRAKAMPPTLQGVEEINLVTLQNIISRCSTFDNISMIESLDILYELFVDSCFYFKTQACIFIA